MLSFSKLKIFIILSVCFISFYFAAPSFLSQNSDSKMSKFFPKDRINLGLDLQGGSQLTLEIDFDYYLKEQVLNLREEIKNSFREEYVQALPEAQGDKILISIMDEEQKSLAKKLIRKVSADTEVDDIPQGFVVYYSQQKQEQKREQGQEQQQ